MQRMGEGGFGKSKCIREGRVRRLFCIHELTHRICICVHFFWMVYFLPKDSSTSLPLDSCSPYKPHTLLS